MLSSDPCMLTQLRLFQLMSPSLPIGAFTYSQGMERAVEGRWITSESDTAQWLGSLLNNSLHYLELPILKRLYNAINSSSAEDFDYWSEYLLSSRETSELRKEEQQRARAFYEILSKLPEWTRHKDLNHYREALLNTQSAGLALAGVRSAIPLNHLLNGYCWSWAENSVNAAIKLVPLGQSAGQALLYQLSAQIPDIVDSAQQLTDEEIGASTPALSIASSLHETQYCRLFRS